MTKRMLPVVATLVFLGAATARAQSHLVPEKSQFSREFTARYIHMVLTYFQPAYGRDVILRMIGMPSFHPEYVVGIKVDAGKYHIFRASPEKQLWGYETIAMRKSGAVTVLDKNGKFVKDTKGIKEMEAKYPAAPADIPRNTCSVAISGNLAQKVRYVWRAMLLRTSYPHRPRLGLDGATFHFSMPVLGRINYAGKIWSPQPGTATGKLVRVAGLMAQYCITHRAAVKDELVVRVDALRAALASSAKGDGGN